MRRVMACALWLLLAPGCGQRGAQPAACVPNASVSCACRGAMNGIQTCQSDGTFGVCDCSLPIAMRADNPDKPPLIVAPMDTTAAARRVPIAPTPQPRIPMDDPPPAASNAPVATPMDQARACLRNNSNGMTAGNQCVVQVLRGSASSEPEIGLLAVTYRTMGRNSDAVRTMRTYITRYPEGPRVGSFQHFIDNHDVPSID